MSALTAADIVRLLELTPHPEGGHFRETFRDTRMVGGRAASTAIYYLLARGERSHWHRVDAVGGLALACRRAARCWRLPVSGGRSVGPAWSRSRAGERPQAIVPAGDWQAAESLGDWTLVGCTVAPGFEFAGFELAPRNWSPG